MVMLITLSRCTAISHPFAEVYLAGVAHLGDVSHRFEFFNCLIYGIGVDKKAVLDRF